MAKMEVSGREYVEIVTLGVSTLVSFGSCLKN